jgi:hypothetical protein
MDDTNTNMVTRGPGTLLGDRSRGEARPFGST